MTPEQEAKCREAFERDAVERGLNITRGVEGDYCWEQTQTFWAYWQVAWSAAQAQQWLPIENAPLCKGRGRELNSVIVGRFPYHGRHYSAALARKTNKGWVIGKGEKLWFEPTHYQPLPTPPEQPTSGQGCEG